MPRRRWERTIRRRPATANPGDIENFEHWEDVIPYRLGTEQEEAEASVNWERRETELLGDSVAGPSDRQIHAIIHSSFVVAGIAPGARTYGNTLAVFPSSGPGLVLEIGSSPRGNAEESLVNKPAALQAELEYHKKRLLELESMLEVIQPPQEEEPLRRHLDIKVKEIIP